jgi:cytochrome d ubiquinol oxidase subunit II
VAAGTVTLAGLFVLRDDSPRLYSQLLHQGWPFIAASAFAGLGALLGTLRPGLLRPAVLRFLGAAAVAAVLAGWGSAQYPYLLGDHLDLHDAAAPAATMSALAVVALLALVLVVPSLVWLLLLTHRGSLTADD